MSNTMRDQMTTATYSHLRENLAEIWNCVENSQDATFQEIHRQRTGAEDRLVRLLSERGMAECYTPGSGAARGARVGRLWSV